MAPRKPFDTGRMLTPAVMLFLVFFEAGCGDRADQRTHDPDPQPPTKRILFQPELHYEDKITHQGTGFFVRSPKGKIAAVTSAHFLRREGAPLREVRWLDVRTGEVVARFRESWGQPGSRGHKFDTRPDYLLMPAGEGVPQESVLELDPRAKPEYGERVWFPNKDPSSAQGYQLVEGAVAERLPTLLGIGLDRAIKLQSQSGSPVISQATGKVLGTLSQAELIEGGRTYLALTPSHALLAALANDNDFPSLRTVIGIAIPTKQ